MDTVSARLGGTPLLVGLFGTLAVLRAACQGPAPQSAGPAAPSGDEVRVIAREMPHPMHLHGHPFKLVATDGYPVPEAQALTKDTVTVGPGERYDLLVELDNPGTWVFHCHILSHVQNRGVEPGGMITVLKVAPQ